MFGASKKARHAFLGNDDQVTCLTYRRVLIGTDLSELSSVAAKVALRLGDADTRYRVAHVSPLVEMPKRIDLNADIQRSKLYAWCDEVGVTTREQVVLFGSTAKELVREAASYEADLIVVGHKGHDPLERLFLGSTARSVVRSASCDTLVARGKAPPPTGPVFQSVLVATDFYEPSVGAARRALDLAKEHGAALSLVHAVEGDVWRQAQRTPEAKFPNAPGWVENTYGTMLHEFNVQNLEGKAKEHLTHGSPARAIADHARLEGSDLIVVGTHGARGAERVLLGTHAEAIIERAPCSVLVVR